MNLNILKKTSIITALFLLHTFANAQEVDSLKKVFYLKGKIVNQDNRPITFAHIINLHRSYATVSDSGGRFTIPIVVNDTLRISSIGFHTRFYPIKEIPDSEQKIMLIKREYDLPVVNIYELRWQVFKAEFMEQESEETKVAQKISKWMSNLVSVEELKLIYQSTMAPGFRINYKSKADKSKRKLAKMEKKYKLIAPKFNDKLISSLTGLQGKEIYKFLRYCNFSEDFLIHASEYEIMEQILVSWKEYQRKGLDK